MLGGVSVNPQGSPEVVILFTRSQYPEAQEGVTACCPEGSALAWLCRGSVWPGMAITWGCSSP